MSSNMYIFNIFLWAAIMYGTLKYFLYFTVNDKKLK